MLAGVAPNLSLGRVIYFYTLTNKSCNPVCIYFGVNPFELRMPCSWKKKKKNNPAEIVHSNSKTCLFLELKKFA